MAVYWFDPYIDSAVRGLSGTTDIVTRNGTYSSPFSCVDMFGTVSNGVSPINGITLVNGDEIRIKGLPTIEDFLFNTGTANNTVSGTGINSYYQININNSSDQSGVTLWKKELSNSGLTAGVAVFYDTNIFDFGFALVPLASTFTSSQLKTSSQVSFPYSGYFYALGVSTGITIGFLDPKYYIVGSAFVNNANTRYYFRFNVTGTINVTDGWTSETVRNGVSPLSINKGSNGAGGAVYFGYNSSSGKVLFDIPNTHLTFFSGTGEVLAPSVNIYVTYTSSGLTNKIGSIIYPANNAWSYIDMSNNKGNVILGSYGGYYTQMLINNSYYPSNCTIKNLFMNNTYFSSYSSYTGTTLSIGNVFCYNSYTSNSLFYVGNSIQNLKIKFLDDSYLFGYSSCQILFGQYPPLYLEGTGIMNFKDKTKYAAYTGTTSGPVAFNSFSVFNNPFDSTITYYSSTFSTSVLLAPSTALNANYITERNISIGILDMSSLNYKTTDHNIQLINNENQYNNTFSVSNYHFVSNTYDKKSIGFVTPNTTINNPYVPLLLYNELSGSTNLLCIQCNSYASSNITDYKKSLMLQMPSLATGTTLTLSFDIELSSNFAATKPVCYAYYREVSNSATYNITYSSVGNVHTYSKDITISTLDTNSNFIGLSISVRNYGDYNNKYYIKNIQLITS